MESFTEALAAIMSSGTTPCVFRFSASFLDEDDYDRLGVWFGQAMAAMTDTWGPPLTPSPEVAEPIDVERVACWRHSRGLAFVMLSWGDNTRIRVLELGVATQGTLFRDSSGQSLRPKSRLPWDFGTDS